MNDDKFKRKEFFIKHNHEKDLSIIPDRIEYYLDDFLSVNMYRLNAMEIVNHTKE